MADHPADHRTRGIGGPPAVNKGIQGTPAPITQLQGNPSGVSGTPLIPSTPVVPQQVASGGRTSSPLADEIRRRQGRR